MLSANSNPVNHINKHVDNDAVKEQEKDPLKITPEMANKLLHMIQEKGNQFEMTHKAAAQRMQHNFSAATAQHEADSLQNKLTSPPAPQPPTTVKNATVAQPQAPQPQQSAPQQPIAPAQPVKQQQQQPNAVQAASQPSKGAQVLTSIIAGLIFQLNQRAHELQ